MMSKNSYCTLCLSFDKRTHNIFRTDLQWVYESLANFKVAHETCWMCFICHEKLRQCHMLQQLAVKTRGRIDRLYENEGDIKFDSLSLLDLTTSDTNVCTYLCQSTAHIEREPDENDEFHDDTGIYQEEYVEATTNCEDDKHNSRSLWSDDDQPVSDDYTLKVVNDDTPKIKDEPSLIITDKLSPSVVAKHDCPSPKLVREYFEEGGESTSSSPTTKQIKQEPEEEISDTGGAQDDIAHNLEDSDCPPVPGCYNKPDSEMISTKSFATPGMLEKYITDHNGQNIGYKICIKPLKTKILLEQPKSYDCDVCSKKFVWKRHLEEHARIHTGEKPYCCDICLKKFTRKSSFKRHVKIHTGGKLYTCEVCVKKFTQKSSLIRHIKSHSGEKPYSCDVCLKKFGQKSLLNIHFRIHTGDKPYSCDVCSKKFSWGSNLLKHIRTHTGDKPYCCKLCLKKFTRKSGFERHVRMHTEENP